MATLLAAFRATVSVRLLETLIVLDSTKDFFQNRFGPVFPGMLREHSRNDNRKLIDLATAVVDGHRLLPKAPDTES